MSLITILIIHHTNLQFLLKAENMNKVLNTVDEIQQRIVFFSLQQLFTSHHLFLKPGNIMPTFMVVISVKCTSLQDQSKISVN